MPKIIEKTVYTFDELSEKAKENAKHWYYCNADYFWQEEHICEIESFLCIFNVTLKHYVYDTNAYRYETNLNDCKWQGNNKKDVLERLARYQVGYCAGEGLKQSFLAEYTKNGSIKNAIIAALNKSFKELVNDYKYHFSDEAIKEFFESNDFYFYIDGTIV